MNRPCVRCGTSMRLQRATPFPGTRVHRGRGLCEMCWAYLKYHGGLIDYPAHKRSRDDLLDDYVILRSEGHDWRQCAQRLGMTYPAFQRAMLRARADGDPRAGRIGEDWPAARRDRELAS